MFTNSQDNQTARQPGTLAEDVSTEKVSQADLLGIQATVMRLESEVAALTQRISILENE